MKPLALIVTGPTASGKTGMAIELAEHFGTEIVSADSRQIYKDIPIGTAAPTPEERRRAFHHLVGILPLEAYYSAARFENDALSILHKIWQKNPVAIVCGGSMMYVDALTNGIDEMPDISDGTRNYVLSLYENNGLDGVLAQLRICDPEYYQQVDKANPRRVIHALEVCLEAGMPYSSLRTGSSKKRDFEYIKVAIDMPRDILFNRINARVDAMIAAGLETEARTAFAKGDFNSLNTVGYKELREYFAGRMDLPTATARIAKNTRVYAKKQLTWLKKDPAVHWVGNTAEAIQLAENIMKGAEL